MTEKNGKERHVCGQLDGGKREGEEEGLELKHQEFFSPGILSCLVKKKHKCIKDVSMIFRKSNEVQTGGVSSKKFTY